jgi:hypothetical protein
MGKKENKYSRTPLIRINWDGEPSKHAENSNNWTFFEERLYWKFEFRLLLFTITGIFIDITLPAAVWPSGRLSPKQKLVL